MGSIVTWLLGFTKKGKLAFAALTRCITRGGGLEILHEIATGESRIVF